MSEFPLGLFVCLILLAAFLLAPGESAETLRRKVTELFVGARVCPVCDRIQVADGPGGKRGTWEQLVLRAKYGIPAQTPKSLDACPHHASSGTKGDCRWCHVLRVESLC